MRVYVWWSMCTFCLRACQVRVTIGDSDLCCVCVTSFESYLTPLFVDSPFPIIIQHNMLLLRSASKVQHKMLPLKSASSVQHKMLLLQSARKWLWNSGKKSWLFRLSHGGVASPPWWNCSPKGRCPQTTSNAPWTPRHNVMVARVLSTHPWSFMTPCSGCQQSDSHAAYPAGGREASTPIAHPAPPASLPWPAHLHQDWRKDSFLFHFVLSQPDLQ